MLLVTSNVQLGRWVDSIFHTQVLEHLGHGVPVVHGPHGAPVHVLGHLGEAEGVVCLEAGLGTSRSCGVCFCLVGEM